MAQSLVFTIQGAYEHAHHASQRKKNGWRWGVREWELNTIVAELLDRKWMSLQELTEARIWCEARIRKAEALKRAA